MITGPYASFYHHSNFQASGPILSLFEIFLTHKPLYSIPIIFCFLYSGYTFIYRLGSRAPKEMSILAIAKYVFPYNLQLALLISYYIGFNSSVITNLLIIPIIYLLVYFVFLKTIFNKNRY